MRSVLNVLALATAASAASQGFNYGSTMTSGAAKTESDFEAEFKTAQGLVGTNGGFTSARLYTMVQGGTASDPISAIQAAINTKTTLLLGLWASGNTFPNELTALTSAIKQYGSDFTSLVVGISVGSEDLYRNSPMGIEAGSDIGANPDDIVGYIKQVRSAISGTTLSGAPVGHVDTWTAWVNGSNSGVVDACDFLGVDAYPYFQTTMYNDISVGKSLFNDAMSQTAGNAKGKPVWVTETGWPVSGKQSGQASTGLENAKTYWDEVGCPLFGATNTWWYTLQDASPSTPNPSFGLVGNPLTTTPLFDLSCSNVSTVASSSAAPTSTKATTTSPASSGSTGTSVAASSEVASSAASSPASIASATSTGVTGGSPGIVNLSSQLSLEASATPSGSFSTLKATSLGTAAGSTSTGSAGGVNATITSAGTSAKTSATPSGPTSTSTTVSGNSGVALQSGSVAAAFLAIMAAIFAL